MLTLEIGDGVVWGHGHGEVGAEAGIDEDGESGGVRWLMQRGAIHRHEEAAFVGEITVCKYKGKGFWAAVGLGSKLGSTWARLGYNLC